MPSYSPTAGHGSLFDLYQRKVLPALFDRLDQAFPEFSWTKTSLGYKGVAQSRAIDYSQWSGRTIWCDHSWGYAIEGGQVGSWLAYVNGGNTPGAEQFPAAVEKLARLAGVDVSHELRYHSREDVQDAVRRERKRELLEAAVAYCREALRREQGHAARNYLVESRGFDRNRLTEAPLGYYTSLDDVRGHLRSLGFTTEEITDSHIDSDARVAGRLIIPWRDRYGEICTIAAFDHTGNSVGRSGQLYLRGSSRPDAFGLNVAFRNSSGGREHLILAEGLLEAVYLQLHGLPNVATVSSVASVVSGDFWKMLAAEHVQHVTLAFADESDGWRRTLGSIDSASRANATPDVYTLAPGDLENCRTPSQLARLHGMPKLKAVLERRLHGYRLAANDIIARHKNGPHWTDAGLIDALYEAVRFDSGVTRSDEKAKLERFFWKTILDSTGGDSEMVERLLHRRFAHLEQAEEDPKVSRYRRLPADLSAALDADNVTRFEDLILQTARDIERDRRPVAANPLRWEPPRTWQPPEPERKDEPWQSEEFVSAQEETLRYEPPPPQLQPREPVVSRHYTYTTGSYPTGNGTAGRSYSPGDVRLAAYYLWENRGRPVGQEEELWFEAERRLRQGAAV